MLALTVKAVSDSAQTTVEYDSGAANYLKARSAQSEDSVDLYDLVSRADLTKTRPASGMARSAEDAGQTTLEEALVREKQKIIASIAAGLAAAQPVISAEYLITQNPDFLFGAMSIRKPDDILSADSAVLKTRAGKEGNISIIPSSYFLRPSPRLADKLPEFYREVRRCGKAGGN